MTSLQSLSDQNTKTFATLTLQGFVKDIGRQLDMALAYCFESQASQSYIWNGQVTSVQRILHDNAGDFPGTCTSLQISLENYLTSIFGQSSVEVTSDAATVQGSKVALFVYASVTINGKEYNTAAGMDVKNSAIVKFFDLNNTGPSY